VDQPQQWTWDADPDRDGIYAVLIYSAEVLEVYPDSASLDRGIWSCSEPIAFLSRCNTSPVQQRTVTGWTLPVAFAGPFDSHDAALAWAYAHDVE
jgi:hypothetical protein